MSAKTHKITMEYHSIEAEVTSLSAGVLALFFGIVSTLAVKFWLEFSDMKLVPCTENKQNITHTTTSIVVEMTTFLRDLNTKLKFR